MGVLSLLLGAFSLSVKDCGGNQATFRMNELSVRPVNPNPGDDVILHVQYTVPEGVFINDGTATYAIKYNFIPLSPTVEPLCKDLPCPLGPGTYTNETITAWPSGLTGSVSTKITWADEKGALLACISMEGKARRLVSFQA